MYNYGYIFCGFKMEKFKIFWFSGDVRDYVILRVDFKYVIDIWYGKREVILLLSISL